MGGGSSRTRKLTVENEDPIGVIKLSEDVVDRIKGSETPFTESDKAVRSITNSSPSWPVVPGNAPPGIGQYYHEPILTSLQIRQEKAAALKKNDEYWEQRILDMEKVHGTMHKVMEEEYYKAVQEVKNEHSPNPSNCFTVPCQNDKKAVIECYKKYPNEPMRCAKEVEQFSKCVDYQRAALIENKG